MQQLSTATAAAPDSEKSAERETKTPSELATEAKRNVDGGRDTPETASNVQSQPTRGASAPISALLVDGLGLFALSLVAAAPWARAGLWDPVEVRSADLARRAAIHLFGGSSLAVAGATDAIPTVEEVGRGELPILLTALSLRVFGSHVWAVRLPLFVLGMITLVALFTLCRRLASKEVAWVSAVVLATLPAFFVQVRAGIGDSATIACVALAFCGFHLAWADAKLGTRARLAALCVGVLGAIGAYFCRGAWIGLAVPTLSSGLVWLFLAEKDALRLTRIAGISALGIGAIGLALGFVAWLTIGNPAGGTAPDYSFALGSAINAPKKLPTHDTTLAELGHALFPWSALVPAALGVALTLRAKRQSESALTLGLFLVLGLGMFAHGSLTPRLGAMPFVALFAVGGVCALGIDELNRRRESALFLATVGAALLVLLMEDFQNEPLKAFAAFGLDSSPYSSVTVPKAKLFFRIAAGFGIGAMALLALEHVQWVGGWIARLWRVKGVTRARLAWAPMLVGGLVLSWGYYPALAKQLSPAGVYETYARYAKGQEPLGVVGKAALQGSAFYSEAPLQSFESSRSAIDWLIAGGLEAQINGSAQRRWLVLKRKDLAAANSFFRVDLKRGNLPIIDAESSEILLASNRLDEGKQNLNPLSNVVLDAPPVVPHPLTARLGIEMDVLGWGMFDEKGNAVDKLTRGKPYDFRIFYSVIKRPGGNWKTFIHIDGSANFADKRVNGDHDTTPDYPMREWQVGDVVVDSFRMQPDVTYPVGEYSVYFGLFSGNQRLAVSLGEHKDNRVVGGSLLLE